MNSILNIYAKNSGVINRTITSKYKEVIEDVRHYMGAGFDKDRAVTISMTEWAWKFESPEDKAILLQWFSGSFGKTAA